MVTRRLRAPPSRAAPACTDAVHAATRPPIAENPIVAVGGRIRATPSFPAQDADVGTGRLHRSRPSAAHPSHPPDPTSPGVRSVLRSSSFSVQTSLKSHVHSYPSRSTWMPSASMSTDWVVAPRLASTQDLLVLVLPGERKDTRVASVDERDRTAPERGMFTPRGDHPLDHRQQRLRAVAPVSNVQDGPKLLLRSTSCHRIGRRRPSRSGSPISSPMPISSP